ncbi:hypothetical protein EVAR_94100_1 [Eumeta japonica]|uniref:Uncharacterized protein n=1 Tax=Eumeta variegata TaxID=151549 RepID=A0A4C1V8K2_EUMVA|nr:hypothetical protein EVAR_94100_1 [Eumeta japonica]
MNDFQGLKMKPEEPDNGAGSLEAPYQTLKINRGQNTFQGNSNKSKYENKDKNLLSPASAKKEDYGACDRDGMYERSSLRLGVTYEKGVTLGNVTMSHRTRERPAECLASLSHSTMIGLPRAQH